MRVSAILCSTKVTLPNPEQPAHSITGTKTTTAAHTTKPTMMSMISRKAERGLGLVMALMDYTAGGLWGKGV